jgi:hypothetical protein
MFAGKCEIHRMKQKWTKEPPSEERPEALVELIKAKSRNLFLTRQFQCAQACGGTLLRVSRPVLQRA